MVITGQEATITPGQKHIEASDLIKRLIEQVSFEARDNEHIDKKSGVSARLTISAFENDLSAAERRALIHNEKNTQVWLSDLLAIIPSITGKIELLYEGEQEGPFQVAVNLLDKAIRTMFVQYFPSPELLKKRKGQKEENIYKPVINWFDGGNALQLHTEHPDAEKITLLQSVPCLLYTSPSPRD